MLETGIHSTDCNCSSCPEWAAKDNAVRMKSTVDAAAKAAGTNAKLFAYGFDEAPISCEKVRSETLTWDTGAFACP